MNSQKRPTGSSNDDQMNRVGGRGYFVGVFLVTHSRKTQWEIGIHIEAASVAMLTLWHHREEKTKPPFTALSTFL